LRDHRAGDSLRRFATITGFALLVLLVLEGLAELSLRMRQELAVYALVLGLIAWLRRGYLLRPGPLRTALLVCGLVSIVPVVSTLFLGFEEPTIEMTRRLLPTLCGWVALLVILPLMEDSEVHPVPPSWRPSLRIGVLSLALAFAVLVVAHAVGSGRYAIGSDDAVYLTQARWMTFPQLSWPVSADLAPFLVMRKVGYVDGHLFGMYAPGWPALLSVFGHVGLEWWSVAILGTLSVGLTYAVGKRLFDARTGAVAAALLATSAFFVVQHVGYMSHGATIAALLGATWCLHAGIEATTARRGVLWFAAGALLGYVVTVRPLTGITIGTSIGLWMLLLAGRKNRRLPLTLIGLVVAGGIAPAAFLILYNKTVLGGPLAVSYDVLHPGLYKLGFGLRGVIEPGFPFGATDALRALVTRVVSLNTTFVPIGLLAPIVAIAVAAGFTISWWHVGLFSLLPVAHFFYWYGGLRLYAELLPFLLLGTAAMLVFIHDRWPRLAMGIGALLLGSQLIVALPWTSAGDGHRPLVSSDYFSRGIPGRHATLQTADSLARVHGRVLLFSRDEDAFDNQIDRLYQHNGDRFNGPILVMRDRGDANGEVIRRFPDRVPFLVEDRGREQGARFTSLPR
jgi:hypothetical protein